LYSSNEWPGNVSYDIDNENVHFNIKLADIITKNHQDLSDQYLLHKKALEESEKIFIAKK